MLQLLAMHAERQGDQEIHDQEHGRISCHSYVIFIEELEDFEDIVVDQLCTGDISDASVFAEYAVPKMYLKLQYCVSCAIHGKIVRYGLSLK